MLTYFQPFQIASMYFQCICFGLNKLIGLVKHNLFISLNNVGFHLNRPFQKIQEIILCFFQQSQIIEGQN
jgi:hypothetical protein